MMKQALYMLLGMVLLGACGQSYEESKRISREQRREAARKDSAALKIAVMPTLDCLPLFVAKEEQLLDSLNGGVRLKMFNAQMDCDTALTRGRVEGMVTDIVRAKRIEQQGTALRYLTTTTAYWQLITNRLARIHQPKQLDHKMVGMTRYSITDSLTNYLADTTRMARDRVFKIQLNDIFVRMQMLQNNEIDAVWLTEPQATVVRVQKHQVIFDTRQVGMAPGRLVFRDQEMSRPEREKQQQLLVQAWNEACKRINERGVKHYRDVIEKYCKVKGSMVDSLPSNIRFDGIR
ncbi:MAG: ABC transporter substrate-binding protein [Prevotella sp.]|nr:ABC transporter substrate-binding protein [Prevotella sp.]